jgi:crotonobetainyl-CoA:carnitine CoA-transferase CaiB-like acyl-CoA transferase
MQAGLDWDPDGDSLESLREGSRRFFRANEGNPDPNTSLVATASTMLALRARRRTGHGQQVFVSMLCANGYANADDFLAYAGKPDRPLIDHEVLGTGPLRRLYQVGDGWVCLSLPDEAQWSAFCAATGAAALTADVRFQTAQARALHSDELSAALGTLLATRDADDWEQLLARQGIGCVRADGYRGAGDFFLHDPQIEANGWVHMVTHPVMGEYRRWGPLVTFARTPGRYGPGVLAGQQTDKILSELGYDEATTSDLHSRGVVWTDHPAE